MKIINSKKGFLYFLLFFLIDTIFNALLYLLNLEKQDGCWIIDKGVRNKLYFKVEASFARMILLEITNVKPNWYFVLREKICRALIMGPALNSLIRVLSTITFLIRPDVALFMYSLIINAIMLLMELYSNNNVLGDFVAYNYVKNNEMYSIQIVY